MNPASDSPGVSGAATIAAAKSGPKTWRAGTLVYTSGALIALFAWLLLGDFAWWMRERSVGPMSQWYLNSLGVPNLVFGLLITSFPAALLLFIAPFVSVKSDRHRGPRGRRIPFLLVATPIGALGMIGIGLTPVMARWMHGALGPGHGFGRWMHSLLDGSSAGVRVLAALQNEMVVAVVCFGVFWAVFECAAIASKPVFDGLINDVVPKELLGRFFGLFRAISLIDGMIFNYWIIGHVPIHFTVIMCSIGLFYGVAFMWVCYKVREGGYPPPAEPARAVAVGGRAGGLWRGVRAYSRECFTSPYYLAVFVMWMLAGLTFGPVNIFSIPYARSLNVDMAVYGKMLALTYLISLSVSFFLGWLADIFHPLRMAVVSLAGYAVVTAWGAIYATSANTFLIAFVVHGVLAGCYFTSTASLGQRLFPHGRFAQFASAATVFSSLGNFVLAPAVGLLIDATDRAYRLTFVAGCVLALAALACAFYVYGKFVKLGGPKAYAAPE